MFSTTSFAEWKSMNIKNDINTKYYLNEKIRKHGGFIYAWILSDLVKPDKFGNLSYKSYWQVDCKVPRIKNFQEFHYAEQMGKGSVAHIWNSPDKNPLWTYIPPDSAAFSVLEFICSY